MHKHCLQFLLGVEKAPRETENNAYAKFWGDKQRVLWYVMVFSGVVNWDLSPGFIQDSDLTAVKGDVNNRYTVHAF